MPDSIRARFCHAEAGLSDTAVVKLMVGDLIAGQAVADRRSALTRCIAEALRLRAPGIDVRAAACDLALPCGHGQHVVVRKARSALGTFPTSACASHMVLSHQYACPKSATLTVWWL